MEEMIFVGFWSRLGLLTLPFCSQIYEPQNQEFSLSKILFENFNKSSVPAWYFFIFIFSVLCFNASLIIICTTISFLFSPAVIPLWLKKKKAITATSWEQIASYGNWRDFFLSCFFIHYKMFSLENLGNFTSKACFLFFAMIKKIYGTFRTFRKTCRCITCGN